MTRTWHALRTVLTAAVMLAMGRAAAAQDRGVNPHGKLEWECGTCHRADAWTPVRITKAFDHGTKGFPLTGAHASTPCRACHVTLDFRGTDRNCVACHKDVHQGELGVNCVQCHTPRSFLDRSAMVRAHRETRFPLTGGHLSADCESCHTPSGQGHLTFVNRPTDCVQCHLASYQTAQNPNHQAGGFPLDCNQCHSTAAWPLARFSHANTGFPLTGAHLATPCSSCHGDGVYKGKPTTCVACHQKDYAGVTNLNHVAAGFPTDCTQCHTTTAWTGATFNHDGPFFPIYSGRHKGQWSTCSQCHTNPSNYAQFSCTTCHGPETTSHHSGVAGYSYNSQACYSCHPRP